MPQITLTHRGWFLLCPVYLAELTSDEPFIEPRRFVPVWWLIANEIAFGVFEHLARAIDPEFDPPFPILITGEVGVPIVLDVLNPDLVRRESCKPPQSK